MIDSGQVIKLFGRCPRTSHSKLGFSAQLEKIVSRYQLLLESRDGALDNIATGEQVKILVDFMAGQGMEVINDDFMRSPDVWASWVECAVANSGWRSERKITLGYALSRAVYNATLVQRIALAEAAESVLLDKKKRSK